MTSLKASVRLRFSPGAEVAALAVEAEERGFHGVWVSEPWGFDAGPVLGALALQTQRVVLGTHIASVFARTPTATAGLVASLAVLTGPGRVRLGLGTSGPQVVEGWHGTAFDRPLARTRDTIAVVRKALSGEKVEHDGATIRLPRPDGPGRALRFSQLAEPIDVPIYLGALGPRNQQLAADEADGWTPTPYSPDAHDRCSEDLEKALADNGRRAEVTIAPVCPIAIGEDVDEMRALERPWSALYLGGMGTPDQNFYASAVRRMGHDAMVEDISTAWRSKDRRGAARAVQDDYIDSIGLFGPPGRIRERLARYEAAGVDEVVFELRKTNPADQLTDLRLLGEVLTT